jgi:CheY-like chemotaxis protein
VSEELAPYRPEARDAATIEGPDLLLRPKAATALGMAVHELATNAAKYGAWSAPAGQVEVGWNFRGLAGARTLCMTWRERGGPKVEPPQRRGFGSVLIERTLAYEMNGTVRLDFAAEGLVCEIDIPEDQLSIADSDPDRARGPRTSGSERTISGVGRKRILIVEDSALVAMEVETALRDMGWEIVGPANGLERALDLLEREAPDGAVLDIRLGADDVYPIADLLLTRSVPFVFATGYDQTAVLPERFQHTLTIQKPFDAATLKAAALKTFA